MGRIGILVTILGALIFSSCGKKPVGIVEKEFTYSGGGVSMKGYLAYDGDLEGARPGVLVVPEWWGLNDYPRKRARMLAHLGYAAFALDMYGDGKTADRPDSAGKMAMGVMQNMDNARARFESAYNLLKEQSVCDSTRIGAIGYCFGGGIVLNMALLGVPLDGVVSFHGSLPGQPPPGAMQSKTPVLVCNGAADPFNPPPAVDRFKKMMDSMKVDYKFIDYPGALHAFTNTASDSIGKLFKIPVAYNAAADTASWSAMQDFFKGVFRR
ncbi:MAG TPA: dienelactone hydrolase family protein [Bacteroidota bacterium]|nr:dienelactone hydrolase family protein [Bacteroidota bacterium]